jgi:nucleotide-binding universal stress UspA family protein
MTSTTTILVGVESSDRSDDAIAIARELATVTDSRLLLATAVAYPVYPLVGGGVVATIADDLMKEADERLADKAEPLRSAGLTVDYQTRAYESAPQLLQSLAEEESAALVVVGSTRSGRWGRVLPGSTGERLLHGAPCPVMIAPAGYRGHDDWATRRVGVAFDGSDESRAALTAGASLVSSLGGELEVVSVLDVADFASPALMGGPGYDRIPGDLEARATRHLDAVVAELSADIQVRGCLLAGDPAERLASHSESLDLLIAGSRRYGPLRAVLLGGVSGRLIRHAACPVIVTPRGVERPLDRLLAGVASTAPRA